MQTLYSGLLSYYHPDISLSQVATWSYKRIVKEDDHMILGPGSVFFIWSFVKLGIWHMMLNTMIGKYLSKGSGKQGKKERRKIIGMEGGLAGGREGEKSATDLL